MYIYVIPVSFPEQGSSYQSDVSEDELRNVFKQDFHGEFLRQDINASIKVNFHKKFESLEYDSLLFPAKEIPLIGMLQNHYSYIEFLVECKSEEWLGHIEQYLCNLCLALHIAIPSTISFDGLYSVSDFVHCIARFNPILDEYVINIDELPWPSFHKLGLTEVMRWLYSIEDFSIGFPKGQVGRAVSMFSHIIFGNDVLQFTWAISGLEAIFGRDRGGKMEQILTKSELLLGPRVSHKKSLQNLYNFRSRFLHGDVNLPVAYTRFDGVEGIDDIDDELHKSAVLSIAVLWVSIQELVQRQKVSLEFEFTII